MLDHRYLIKMLKNIRILLFSVLEETEIQSVNKGRHVTGRRAGSGTQPKMDARVT